MSTPFPLEDQAQLDRAQPVWNPWQGSADPHWYSGIGFGDDTAHLGPLYQIGTGAGSGAEKGAALLTGLYGKQASMLGSVAQTLHIPGSSWLNEQAQEISGIADTARENAKKLTPDPATTGTAAQVLNSLSSGITRYTVGALAGGPVGGALTVGSTEANSRYQELRDQGVDEETARASAGLAGITSAAGAFMPGGYGSTLLTRLATGAGANVGFGMANRYLDHKILEDGGYHEMADQQRALDSAQLLTDTVLGFGFGGLAHLHAGAGEARVNATPTWTPTPREVPGVEDAALTANLALRDRAAAPGVPVDPAAANAHSAAMEKATADLLQGNPVDVSGTGVDRADFLRRPAPDTTEPENMLVNMLKDSGILDEERNLQELEQAMGRRLRGEREPEAVQTPATTEPPRQARDAIALAQQNNTFSGQAPGAGRTVGFTQPHGTPVEELFSNFADQKSTPEARDEFREQMFSRADRDPRQYANEPAVTHNEELPDGSTAEVTAARNGYTRVRLRRGEIVVASAGIQKGMIDSIATTREAKGTGAGRALLHYLGDRGIANVHEVPDRSPEFVKAQKAVLGERQPESVTSEAPPAEEGYTVGEEELTDEQRQAFERGPAADENVPADVGGSGQTGQAGRPQDDGGRGGLGSTERPTRLYRGSAVTLTPEHFEPAALGHATGHPSSGLGVYFTNRRGDAARYGNVSEHDLTLRNPKRIPVEELPGFDTLAEATAYREKLRSQGHDGIVIDSSHLGGPKHYVAFDADRVTPVGETAAGDPAAQAIADRPGLQIADQDGNATSAADQLRQADTAAAQGEQDAPKATEAAINCFLRKGG